jgi:hypothetical protein
MIRTVLACLLLSVFCIGASATTIYDVQTDPSLFGQIVTVQGVVTAPNGLYSSSPENIAIIQDGTGPYSGVMIYCGDGLPTLALGDLVEVTGTVAEYYDRTEIDLAVGSDCVIIGSEAVPPVTWITCNDLSSDNPGVAEQYEGVLVGIENVTVVEIGSYEFTADDGVGQCLVSWWSSTWETCPVNLNDFYSSIAGTGDYSYGFYKLHPRYNEDYNYPVPVEFGTLSADSRGDGIVVRWSTVTEQDNFGFNVLRAGLASGPFETISDQIILGAGTTAVPQTYLFSDEAVFAGETYFYMVRDISSSGATTDHGPVSCTFLPEAAGSWGSIKADFAD